MSVGEQLFDVRPGVAIAIPIGELHQVTNTGAERLKFISVDSPSWLLRRGPA